MTPPVSTAGPGCAVVPVTDLPPVTRATGVVGTVVMADGELVVLATEQGFAKRTDVDEFPVQTRGGAGLKAAKIDKGSPTVGNGATVGRVTTTQLREIAEIMMKDMNANDVEAAVRMLAGSAKSMGLTVVEG